MSYVIKLFADKNNTLLRYGKPEDFLYIDSLRKVEGNALGFVPAETLISILENRPQLLGNRSNKTYSYSGILLTSDNNDSTGYCYFSLSGDIAKIFQIVVQQDARRWHRALLMIDEVEKLARTKQKQGISARVAFDLESNHFWKSIGYTLIGTTISTWLNQKESKCKRPINIYFKPLSSLYKDQLNACQEY